MEPPPRVLNLDAMNRNRFLDNEACEEKIREASGEALVEFFRKEVKQKSKNDPPHDTNYCIYHLASSRSERLSCLIPTPFPVPEWGGGEGGAAVMLGRF